MSFSARYSPAAAWAFGLLIPFVCLLIASSVPAQEPVVVATYNTRLFYDEVDNPLTDDERFVPKTKKELRDFKSVLRAMDADIVGLQEIEGKNAIRTFLNRYGSDLGYDLYIKDPKDSMFNVALLSRYPVRRTIRYGHANDGKQSSFRYLRQRMVYFEVVPDPDYTLHIFVCHLKANQDERSQGIRYDMIKSLKRWIINDLKLDPQTDNILVMGDLNDHADSRTIQWLTTERGLGLVNLTSEEPNPDLSMSSSEPNSQLDYLLASPALANEYISQTARVVGVPSLPVLQSASDHLPVVAAILPVEAESAVETQELVSVVSAESTERLEKLRAMVPPSEQLRLKRERELKDLAEDDGAIMTIAALKDEADQFISQEKTPPMRVVTGTVAARGDKMVAGRIQIPLVDGTGGIIIDERGGDSFPVMPQPGDMIRVTGLVSLYRDIHQMRPAKPVEIINKAVANPNSPRIDFAELARNGEKYMSTRVTIEGRVISQQTVRPGTKYELAPSGQNGINPDSQVHMFIPNVAFSADVADGTEVVVSGIVTKYNNIYQVQPLAPDQLTILDSSAK